MYPWLTKGRIQHKLQLLKKQEAKGKVIVFQVPEGGQEIVPVNANVDNTAIIVPRSSGSRPKGTTVQNMEVLVSRK